MKVALRRSLRHFIAVVVFLIIAALYCRPALQGKVLTQSDIIQWKGMSKSSLDYKDQFGHFPLWTNSMFSGMPAYQIAMDPDIKFYPGILHGLFTLWLPKPISFFFLACVCFYFLSQVLKTTTYIGIIGALSFAYATYNIGIIEAGHETKMLSIAYIPALIASLILVYERKYLVGATLAALCTMLLIAVNHPQIAYYTFLTSLILTIGYCVRWFRQRQFKHAFVSMGVVLIAGLIGIACNAVLILTSLDLSKTTIRGGSELPNQNSTKTGLTTDYALSYSMLKTEPFVMMVPDMYGGSGRSVLEKSEDSKTAEVLQAMPPEIANDLSGITQAYWGGIGPIAPNAPFYLGAIICFIGLVGFFILDNKHKWWILGTILLSFFMAWGAYFKDFNTFLLHSLPGYNKFRVPSMIICIPIFLFSVMAILTLQKILSVDNKDLLLKQYKKGLLLAAGSFVLLFLIYLSSDFISQADKEVLAQASQTSQQIQNYITQVLNAVKEDRENLFLSSMYRSLVFIIMAAFALWLYIKIKIAPWIALSLIAVLSFIDILSVDVKYLNSENYQDELEYAQNNFTPSELDNQLLTDTSFYRVLDRRQRPNTGGAMTAYFHNSVEGYNAAKLSIYQDLIEHQFSKFPQTMHILNMLNTKYILQSNQQGQDVASVNSENLGPVWFIKAVTFHPTAIKVMDDLTKLTPEDTAVVFSKDEKLVSFSPIIDPSDTIFLVRNNNDEVVYQSNTSSNRFAVFSEVFYDKGWKAYVDEKEAPIVRTNYVLRGLSVPAGKHSIRFVFRPSSFYTGKTIATFSGIILWLLIMATFVYCYKTLARPTSK